jgi:HEXXH motif-containing protein
MKKHNISDSDFDDFAAGYGTVDGIAALRSGQVSRRLLILREIVNDASTPRLADTVAVLGELQRQAPKAFLDTIAAPTFGTWCALTRRAVIAGDPLTADLVGHLGAFAAAVGIAGGVEFECEVAALDDAVYLPGLGRAAAADRWVTVRGKTGEYRVGDVSLPAEPGVDGRGWLALRRLSAQVGEARLDVFIDDLDPWRDNHRLSAAGRRPVAEITQWQRLLSDAWRVLAERHPRYAAAIAAGLHTIVPLNPPSSGNAVNATSMWAFGSVSLTLPTHPTTLASSLLHEFQHAKLGALLDLFELYVDDGTRRHYAPWRDDPRHLSGILQGVYAFMGVTDFYRVERTATEGAQARFAELEYARWREQVWRTYQGLEASDAFTPAGRRFLAGMRATQLGWLDDEVSGDAAALASDLTDDHWISWRLRNVEPDPGDLSRLVAAWRERGAASSATRRRIVPRDVRARARNARLDLALLRLNDPDEFAGTCAQPAGARWFTDADTAYARGDHTTATAAYLSQIRGNPDDRASWAGLALSARHLPGPSAEIWATVPELPFAVHRAIRDANEPGPDPAALAAWLATADQVGGGSTTQ